MGYIAYIDKNSGTEKKPRWVQILKLPTGFAKSFRLRSSANKEAKKLIPKLKQAFRGAPLRIRTKKVKF